MSDIGQPAADRPLAASERRRVGRRYDRVAAVYDLCDAPMEWAGGRRRRRRVISAPSGRVLEVGIGTAANLPYYPDGVRLVGVDLSWGMLTRAARRIGRAGRSVGLAQADVEHLPFPDATFDTVTATCVFCSVADPVAGLAEVARVTKPDGRVLLLEHVRPRGRLAGWLADVASPLTRRLFGFSVNRRTEQNARAAGLELVEVRRAGIWREIAAAPARRSAVGSGPATLPEPS
jgi:ubiquinone/menaquinone biosynthesis C-methylase UbiE